MNYNKNFYWKNRLNKGINKTNLSSNSGNSAPSHAHKDPAVLVELKDKLDNKDDKPKFISYTTQNSRELHANPSDNSSKVLEELKSIKKLVQHLESSINEMKDTLSAMSVGDVLHDDDLKISSSVRVVEDIDLLCHNDVCEVDMSHFPPCIIPGEQSDVAYLAPSIPEEHNDIPEKEVAADIIDAGCDDLELSHRINFVPVLQGAHRHPENICHIKGKNFELRLCFDHEELDEYIIYPFGKHPAPIPMDNLATRLYFNLTTKNNGKGDMQTYIFGVYYDDNKIIKWKMVGIIRDGEEFLSNIDISKFNYLNLDKPLSFLYK